MAKFRKKPVEIEALTFLDDTHTREEQYESAKAIIEWIKANGGNAYSIDSSQGRRIIISTLEGDMTTMPGDKVIMGVQKEFYPCKPDIFAATYDPA